MTCMRLCYMTNQETPQLTVGHQPHPFNRLNMQSNMRQICESAESQAV